MSISNVLICREIYAFVVKEAYLVSLSIGLLRFPLYYASEKKCETVVGMSDISLGLSAQN